MKNRITIKRNILIIIVLSIVLIQASCRDSRSPSERTTETFEAESVLNDKPRLIDDGEEGEDDSDYYSRTLARANQTQNAGDAMLTETSFQDKMNRKNYTLMIYMTGSDLEERHGSATKDLKEMMDSGLNYDENNLIVYTGGAKRWNMGISSATNNVLDMSRQENERVVATTKSNSDMGSPDTLSEFLNYTVDHYPADHYALVFWNHGGGSVYGYGKDTLYKGDSLLLHEMKTAMEDSVFAKEGKYRLDWVGFDACLMATLENAVIWKDYTDHLVASEELEPGDGWDYSFLKLMNENTDSSVICRGIVDTFKEYYTKNRTAAFHPDVTLAVMDLSRTDETVKALNALTGRMNADVAGGAYAEIVRAHVGTKTFGLLGDERGTTFDLLDIRDLADRLDSRYSAETGELKKAVESMVSYRTDRVPGSCGVSMYFPGENKELYQSVSGQDSDNMFASKEFQDFTGSYAERWLQASNVDWKVGGFSEKGEELQIKLTDEQAANMADASYSVLLNIDKGTYVRAMSGIKIKPDENNILHIPRDPDMIFVKGTRQQCSFYESDQREGRKVYSSQSMFISYDISFNSNTGVTAFLEDRGGALSTQSVQYDEADLMGSGKNTVNLTEYATAWEYNYQLSPSYSKDGGNLPYYNWTFHSNSYSAQRLDFVNDGTLEFEYGKSSEAKYPAILQVLVKDINGQDHASDIFYLSDGQEEEEKTIQKKTEKGIMTFTITDGKASLKEYEGDDIALELPSKVDGFPLISIDHYSISSGANKLKELIIPEGVLSLKEMAMAHNTVEKVSLPATLENISLMPFYDCGNLKSIEVADRNPCFKAIDGVLFTQDGKRIIAYPDGKGKKYRVPEGTEEIGEGAFYESAIENIQFPDSINKIGTIAFYGCEELDYLRLPRHLSYIGNGAFAGLFKNKNDLQTLQIGPEVEFIGEYAFQGLHFHDFQVDPENKSYSSRNGLLLTRSGDIVLECPNLIGNKVIVPEGTIGLMNSVFRDLSPSTVFVLPDSLCRMNKYAFPSNYNDSGEEDELTIVCSKGSAAEEFAYKYGFKAVQSDSDLPEDDDTAEDRTLHVVNGICHFNVYKDHAVFVSYEGTDQFLSIPDSIGGKPVTEIGDGENSVEIVRFNSIFDTDFADNDSGLTARERAGSNAGLTKIYMPDSIKRINKNAFSGVSEYDTTEYFRLPDQLEYISPLAFGDSSNDIPGFSISEDNKNFCCIDGVLFSKDKEALIMFPSKIEYNSEMIYEDRTESGTEYYYRIPEGTKTISKYAFRSMGTIYDKNSDEKYTHITFPSSVEEIENNAFHMARLYNISLNEGLKSVGEEAFSWCFLKDNELVLPDSMEDIHDQAFYNVSTEDTSGNDIHGFRRIELPAELKSIGKEAFSVAQFNNDEVILSLDQLYIKADLQEVNSKAFRWLLLKEFRVDESNKSFASINGLLMNHEGTELIAVPNGMNGKVQIPDNTVSVRANAFDGCNGITEIIFPDSVTSISNEAFLDLDAEPVFICSKDSAARKYADAHQFQWKEK